MSSNAINPCVGIVVQARLSSTRLPGKIFKDLAGGKSVVGYLIERLSTCTRVDRLIVATTTNPADDMLEAWLKQHNYLYYRGSEDDCLDRFYRASRIWGLDIIVRITSDCPLVVPDIVDDMICYYLNNRQWIDYLSNRQHANFPEGLDVEIFTFRMLEEANHNANRQKEREHINYYFLDRDSRYRVRYYNHGERYDYSRFKLSIDTPEDLEQIKNLFAVKNLPLAFSFNELTAVLTGA